MVELTVHNSQRRRSVSSQRDDGTISSSSILDKRSDHLVFKKRAVEGKTILAAYVDGGTGRAVFSHQHTAIEGYIIGVGDDKAFSSGLGAAHPRHLAIERARLSYLDRPISQRKAATKTGGAVGDGDGAEVVDVVGFSGGGIAGEGIVAGDGQRAGVKDGTAQ
ncbi:hypothetical protein [Desulfovibrio piger]|uniref:hypothetical protein n=1 Tax=Desulfovibrio piger TaxID=901 RepID=UPI003AB5EDD2